MPIQTKFDFEGSCAKSQGVRHRPSLSGVMLGPMGNVGAALEIGYLHEEIPDRESNLCKDFP